MAVVVVMSVQPTSDMETSRQSSATCAAAGPATTSARAEAVMRRFMVSPLQS